MGGRTWTQTELDYVRDHMDSDTAAEIAEELERSASSVYYKIREMRGEQK